MAREAVRTVLEELRRASAADRAVWVSGGREPVCAAGRGPRQGWVGRADWAAGLWPEGESRTSHWGPERARRRARLASAGLTHALARGFEGPAVGPLGGPLGGVRRLILAGTGELNVSERTLDAVGRVIATLEAAEAEEQERARRTHLAERGLSAAAAAHDLRNALATASLECEALAFESDTRRLGAALADARAMAQDFLATTATPARAAVRLLPVLEREARAAADPHGVTVRLKGDGELRALGRRELLARVVRNLSANAVEATPRGGEVALELSSRGRTVVLEVSDRGRGMDAGELAATLEPGRSLRGGTGFGTASVLQCLRRVGGELEIESIRGAGTRCRVTLERAPDEEAWLGVVYADDARRRDAWRAALEAAGLWAVGVGDERTARAWIEDADERFGDDPRAAVLVTTRARMAWQLGERARERGWRVLESSARGAWPSLPTAAVVERLSRSS